MPGRPLNPQAQQMVLNLLEYFENEKRNGGPIIPVQDMQQRVADALKISKRTVYSIKKRKENNAILSSPGATKHQESKTKDLPDS